MRYTKEITEQLVKDYQQNISTKILAEQLKVPERSVIAKLSSLGVYKKKQYLNKRGEEPQKKSYYIEQIALELGCSSDVLESLEKSNKHVLSMILNKLRP